MIPHWDDDPKSWDTLLLGGAELPGVVDIDGSKGRKVDVKTRKGSDGATLTDNGYDPAKVTIKLRIWTPEQWRLWQIIFPLIDPKRLGSVRVPFDVQHPSLAAIGIRSVYVTTVAVPKLQGGVLNVTLNAVEWFPEPKKAKAGTPKATGNALREAGQDRPFFERFPPPSENPLAP